MIEGVELIPLKTHTDERGFFREVLRATNIESFGQLSWSSMYTGTIKAFHLHLSQYDYWMVSLGVIKAALVDCRESNPIIGEGGKVHPRIPIRDLEPMEILLGDNQLPAVLRIPPGVAHGLKVLQGPAHLLYVTSEIYNPQDEGRIAFDALGYDWDKRDIR